jgi:hypothetical protein
MHKTGFTAQPRQGRGGAGGDFDARTAALASAEQSPLVRARVPSGVEAIANSQ